MPMSRDQVRVVDPILSRVALGYKNDMFIGSELFPLVPIQSSGAKIIKFGKEGFIKYNMRRAPGAKTARVQYGYAAGSVALFQDSLEAVVPREWLRDSAAIPTVNLASGAVDTVMQSIHLGLECDQAAIAQDASKYDASNKIALLGADKWSDPAAEVKKQINVGREAIRKKIGVYPNVLEIPAAAFSALDENLKIREKFKYTSSDSLTTDMAARYFEVDKVVVGKSVSVEDLESDFDDLWQHIVLAYVPQQGRTIAVPSFGYTYVLDGHPLVEEAYYDKGVKSWIYPTEFERQPNLTGMNAGYLIQNPV